MWNIPDTGKTKIKKAMEVLFPSITCKNPNCQPGAFRKSTDLMTWVASEQRWMCTNCGERNNESKR